MNVTGRIAVATFLGVALGLNPGCGGAAGGDRSTDDGGNDASPHDGSSTTPPDAAGDGGRPDDAGTAGIDGASAADTGVRPVDSGPTGGSKLPYALCVYADKDPVSRIESSLGRPLDARQAYNSRNDWNSWANVGSYPLGSAALPAPLSVGLILDSGADLATAASGGYDVYYQQLAQNLNQYRSKVAAVRIGWEMNGYWFAWGIVDSNKQPIAGAAANYVAAFRRLAGYIRQYAPWCLIDWCVNQGGPDPTAAYPGDDVVDIIGMDLYEQNVASFSGALGTSTNFLLTWLDGFSKSTSGANAPAGQTGGQKLISFPEWQATKDDGAFVTGMAGWMNARGSRISYQCYWDSDTQVNPGGSLYENAQISAAYVAAWSGTTFGGTIPLSK